MRSHAQPEVAGSVKSWVGAVALVAFLFLLLAAPAAQADKVLGGSFGVPGSGDGQLNNALGLAVNDDTGDVYVVDSDNSRVQRFSAAGAYLSQFGTAGSADGEFATPVGIAIDQSDGSVYVVDKGNNRVQKFSAAGAYLSQFGTLGSSDGELTEPRDIAVDPVNGDVLVLDTGNNRVQRFDSSGSYLSQFGSTGGEAGQLFTPWRLAVDSAGNSYVFEQFNRIQKFSAAGSFLGVLASTPYAIGFALDRGNGHLFVYEFKQNFAEMQLTELDPSGTALGSFASAPGYPLTPTFDAPMTVNPQSGDVYVGDFIQVHRFEDPAVVAIDSVDPGRVSATGASFSGSVNPKGKATQFKFEYRLVGESKWLSSASQSAGEGTSAVPTGNVAVTGLDSNAKHEVRLAATNADGTARSAPTFFTTTLGSPGIRARDAANITKSGAFLRAQLNPFGQPTTYYFEYGTSAAYGSAAPVSPLAAGASHRFLSVSAGVDGLQPGTTYHFRLVAQNASGRTNGPDGTFTTGVPLGCPNATIRAQQGSEYLPDCRAYEQVSPTDKNGYPIFDLGNARIGMIQSSPDGERAVYPSWGIFAGADHGMPVQYRANRTSGGWVSEPVSPGPQVTNPNAVFGLSATWTQSNAALDAALIASEDHLLPEDTNGIVPDVFAYTKTGKLELASRGNGAERTAGGETSPAGVSDDGEHFFFETKVPLVPEEAGRALGRALYDRTGGKTYLVGVDSDENPIGTCGAKFPGLNSGLVDLPRKVSRDGSRVLFETPWQADCGPAEFYLRVDNERTIEVSRSRLTTPEGPSDPELYGASFDMSRIIFSSGRLRDQDPVGGGIYRFELEDESLHLLQSNGSEMRVVMVSPDASHVYFVSKTQIVPGKGTPGNVMLYVNVDGVTRFVADSGSPKGFGTDTGLNGIDSTFIGSRKADISDDGRLLAFSSRSDLTDFQSGGVAQAYLYDEADDTLTCVSCAPAVVPTGDSFVGINSLAADGSAVTWQTTTQLSARDQNDRSDIYRWAAGDLSLISGGRGSTESNLTGISADGSSIFFTSFDTLVPQDTDRGDQDMYVARVGGGFMAPPGAERACSGDTCQGVPRPQPAAAFPTSSALSGTATRPAKRSKGRCGRTARRAAKNAQSNPVKAKRLKKKARNCRRGRS